MDSFWKATAAILISMILGLTVGKQEPDIGTLLTMAVCCMVLTIALSYLKPVLDFLYRLEDLGALPSEIFAILLKAVGIGLVTEITERICADAGSGALGNAMRMLGVVVILSLSVPIFESFLSLLQEILGEL